MTKISVTAKCPKCSSRLSWDEESTHETIILCNNCGLDCGTYGDFKDGAIDAARERYVAMIKEVIKVR